MTTNVPKRKEREPVKVSVYEEFILWYALPFDQKTKTGLENQKMFAEFFHVSERNLGRWKSRQDFRTKVRTARDQWAFEKTQDVIGGIYRSAVKGNDKSQKLWMQIFEGFTEKTETTQVVKVDLSPNDLRFIVEQLPEEYKNKFYGYIREIIDTAFALRNHGLLADRNAPDDIAEESLLGETDIDASDISSSQRPNVLASRYTDRVCEDLVGQVSTNNHQSTAWWREK